ncbi:hypothetical protein SAMN04487972_102149 [Paracoccus halophilus]|uniref:Excalibur calcium-binding domain-containing protein n=1 Tax=Paracoccus halophilus TaxID=376733 RepID=A0A099F994_9RHOB|nr:hypothetical protein [Paracoccus halophilus]KGJ06793.1 hypothetical protein IT41_01050 [Paracoccus halophilus]SFA41542.1 hypothetical protein SAMN04487972_102149 [Paracoccus halophilus]
MQRIAILAVFGPVLALSACAENTGWNPNYSAMNNGTGYATYSQEREAALQGKAPIPRVIPVQLPAEAPTPEAIMGKRAPAQTAATPAAATKAPAGVPADAQVATSGPYPGSTPVLVRYAHQEDQAPGTGKYTRSGGSVAAAERACRGFASADAAQTAFIAAGGPMIDPRGLDPDGDGFVCGWDPRPFRQSRM